MAKGLSRIKKLAARGCRSREQFAATLHASQQDLAGLLAIQAFESRGQFSPKAELLCTYIYEMR